MVGMYKKDARLVGIMDLRWDEEGNAIKGSQEQVDEFLAADRARQAGDDAPFRNLWELYGMPDWQDQ